MDDLLKVLLGETAECLAACWIAVDELRKSPGDSAALVELLRQVRTVQETSRFLGMTSLHAAAGLTLESLESASARRPASIDRIVPIAIDGLQRVEEIIRRMADADAGTVAHSIRIESAASATPAASAPATAAGSEAAGTTPASDGTVPVGADTLGYLLSTVRGLVDAQAEMMRLLNAKDAETGRPAGPARWPADKPPSARLGPAVRVPAAPESPATDVAQALGVAAPGMVRVLLFRDADGLPKAVYLDQVARLEEVDLRAVDHDRGLWVMRSGSDLLPLVPLNPAHRLLPAGRAPVIVFSIGRDSFGLLIESVPEVADATPADPGSRAALGVDVVMLKGRAIEVIDPARHLDRAIRARLERRRADRKRAHAVDAARRAPPADDDLFVRKPTR